MNLSHAALTGWGRGMWQPLRWSNGVTRAGQVAPTGHTAPLVAGFNMLRKNACTV